MEKCRGRGSTAESVPRRQLCLSLLRVAGRDYGILVFCHLSLSKEASSSGVKVSERSLKSVNSWFLDDLDSNRGTI